MSVTMRVNTVVALLAEGVDRNISWWIDQETGYPVALLAEGVDRNAEKFFKTGVWQKSPSSRRAWIEILYGYGGAGSK